MESARSKAELAGHAAAKALADADRAKLVAKDVEFKERRDAVRGSTQWRRQDLLLERTKLYETFCRT